MKVIAINGSPRKTGNTATLLKEALKGAESVGAEVKMINLYSLNFKGCTSCFSCKRKGGRTGHCATQDDLTEVLDEIMRCDVLLLGSPIYLGDVTGEMRSFMERLIFMNLSYEKSRQTYFTGRISTGFIYTMNISEDILNTEDFQYHIQFDMHRKYISEILNGAWEDLVVTDTYQFHDYSRYNASQFDEHHKAEIRKKRFPVDCKKAFDMGARLATQA